MMDMGKLSLGKASLLFLAVFFLLASGLVSAAGSGDSVFIGEAGLETGLSDSEWQSVDLGASYGATPLVFATTQTTNGGQDPSGAHIRGITETGFETQHCEYEASDGCDSHNGESNAWFSVDPSVISELNGLDSGTMDISGGSGGYTVEFDKSIDERPMLFTNIQTENGNDDSLNTQARGVNSDNATVEFCEQQGDDGCDSSHTEETIAWLAVDSTAVERTSGFDYGNFSTGDSNWQSVSFSQDFSQKPVVIADVQTESGTQEALYPEVDNVDTNGASIRFCESGGGDGCDTHATETVAWMAIDPGNVSINATGRTLCDSRGPKNECISSSTHEVSGESYNISSIFQTERSAVFEASESRAEISVSNSSTISGLWRGSFNISSRNTVLEAGASFRPGNGRTVIS